MGIIKKIRATLAIRMNALLFSSSSVPSLERLELALSCLIENIRCRKTASREFFC